MESVNDQEVSDEIYEEIMGSVQIQPVDAEVSLQDFDSFQNLTSVAYQELGEVSYGASTSSSVLLHQVSSQASASYTNEYSQVQFVNQVPQQQAQIFMQYQHSATGEVAPTSQIVQQRVEEKEQQRVDSVTTDIIQTMNSFQTNRIDSVTANSIQTMNSFQTNPTARFIILPVGQLPASQWIFTAPTNSSSSGGTAGTSGTITSLSAKKENEENKKPTSTKRKISVADENQPAKKTKKTTLLVATENIAEGPTSAADNKNKKKAKVFQPRTLPPHPRWVGVSDAESTIRVNMNKLELVRNHIVSISTTIELMERHYRAGDDTSLGVQFTRAEAYIRQFEHIGAMSTGLGVRKHQFLNVITRHVTDRHFTTTVIPEDEKRQFLQLISKIFALKELQMRLIGYLDFHTRAMATDMLLANIVPVAYRLRQWQEAVGDKRFPPHRSMSAMMQLPLLH